MTSATADAPALLARVRATPPSEWRLLATGFTVVGEGERGDSDFDRLVAAVAAGDAPAALADPAAAPFLCPAGFAPAASPAGPPTVEGAQAWLAALSEAASGSGEGGDTPPASTRLAVGAAALSLAVRANFTGPPLPAGWPAAPWAVGRAGSSHEPSTTAAASTPAAARLGVGSAAPGEAAALGRPPLSASGEGAAPHAAAPLYLALALEALLRPLGLLDGESQGEGTEARAATALSSLPVTWPLWALRAVATRQRLLTAPAAATRTALDVLSPHASAVVAALPADLAVPGVMGRHFAATAAAAAALEQAAARLDLRDAGAAGAALSAAATALGTAVGTGGALGVRTVHQAEPKAQLVALLAGLDAYDAADGGGDDDDSGDDTAALEAAETQAGPTTGALAGLGTGDRADDVLPAPRLEEEAPPGGREGGDAAAAAPLPPVAAAALASRRLPPALQALLLGHAALVTRGTADDGLRGWRAAPFVEAVLAQARTRPALRRAARLASARHERGRARTRDRALLTLEQLVEAGRAPEPGPAARLAWAWAAPPAPPAPALGREAADGLLSVGLAAGALEVYEAVEAWDAVALCYRLLGKEAAAAAVVRRRLEARPGDPTLLCALGDITRDEAHYVSAWEASGHRCARAQRALAQAAAARGDWPAAAAAWRAALALNPLHADGWFAAGYAALKLGDDEAAAHAFTRAAAEEPDHADAWNNLAAVHLRAGRARPAFAALSQAVRLHRESWQTWANYAAAALEAGEPLAAARGVGHVIALTRGERREAGLLRALVAAVGGAAARERGEGQGTAGGGAAGTAAPPPAPAPADLVDPAGLVDGEEEAGDGAAAAAAPPTDLPSTQPTAAALASAVGAAVRAAAASPAGAADPEIWTALADLHAVTGHAVAAREARLKAVRSLAGGEWREDGRAFCAYAQAAAALGRAEVAAAGGADPGAGGTPRDLASARLLLKGVLAAKAKAEDEGQRWASEGDLVAAVAEAAGALEAVVGAAT